MELTAADAWEIADALPLALDLEHYRERLTPVALAVLQGESRRTIDKRRDAVLPDVWDGPMRAAIQKGIARLRAELERRLTVLDLAQADALCSQTRSGRWRRRHRFRRRPAIHSGFRRALGSCSSPPWRTRD